MIDKFANALRGVKEGFLDPSIRLQMFLAALAVIAAIILRLSITEWIIVVVCIGMVITAEMLNTCIEQICDLYTTSKNEKIRRIKDLGAGAVFMASLAALISAIFILCVHISGGRL